MSNQELVAVLDAVAGSDHQLAATLAAEALSADGEDLLAAALDAFLGGVGDEGVYDEPSAFEAFIDNGDNPRLYERTIEVVGGLHQRLAPESVLDIGCGDGRVTAAVVGTARRVDLVEPSASLLDSAVAAIGDAGPVVTPHPSDIESFLGASSSDTPTWDLAQSTFALHSLAPSVRHAVFERLAERTSVLAMVEFDVPEFADHGAHAAYAIERYRLGVEEYRDHPEAIRGFLMPVLIGQFAPGRPRHTFEQPADAWCELLAEAGFDHLSVAPVADYWWGPAVLITGVSTRSPSSS